MLKLGSRDMGIDLGTTNILITIKDKGIVLREPSVIAIEKNTGEVIAIGLEAKEMLGKNPEDINVIKPLKDGVIADFIATELLLENLIKKVCRRHNIRRPRVVVGIPSGITEVEKRAVEKVVLSSGAKEVYFIEEPMASAIGANLEVYEPTGNIIVDIGGGTTEVAVISLGGIVESNSIKIAGDELDEDIINYIKKEFNLAIGENMAEKIKIQIGCATPLLTKESIEVKGRDLSTGLPKNIVITSEQVQIAMRESIHAIVECIQNTLEKTPPELSSDLAQKGIYLAGGSSMIKNLGKLISEKTKMPVYVTELALECVVRGTEKALENIEKLKSMRVNAKK